MNDELAAYYMLGREEFAELEAKSPAAQAMAAALQEGDEVLLARVDDAEGNPSYRPVALIRDEGTEALVNMACFAGEQRAAIEDCLEQLHRLTKIAYADLGDAVPDYLTGQAATLREALDAEPFWTVEMFSELDASLYQLEMILNDTEDGSEFADEVGDRDEWLARIAEAEREFDVLRVVIYAEDDDEEE